MVAKKVPVEVMGAGVLNPALAPSQCLRAIVEAYTEYKIVAEQEKTNRREIAAWEKATVANIQAQRDALIKYLKLSFDERAKNFSFLFEKVDQAIADGNPNQLALAINSITEIAKSSPFKDIADSSFVQAALDDPDHEWTI
ncbi:hypothetical protein H6S82_06110 [Planktothrix sp. FACHB-1355]|uniref:Uncharacterized protein n=1 Tax=Aerosakkonema funiforme FACHB-1375 TaxID=2949571 RepID=A0A926VGU1_9CYAN|nr:MULTISPECIES: hypothetical protein [Oscillatoriales]MBD2183542.1 hypothetical protein [Aerosakkonema funiforme FACHB-1375]MBD3558429.1 hypothetical protein [Planktothrix sp. FACHB-1355]